jgi:DNA polymerase-3 subunit epsilon
MNQLKLTRPLITIDVESTGTNPTTDRIITLAVYRVSPDSYIGRGHWKMNPTVPIPPGATECHGITDADVKDCFTFAQKAKEIDLFFLESGGYDLVGFNLYQFDVPIIIAEFERVGVGTPFPCEGCNIIDASVIFKKKEERTLEAAVKFYCKREHKGAHDALNDCEETYAVLLGQREVYPDVGAMTVAELAKFSQYDGYADLAGKLRFDKDGDLVFNIGEKTRGKKVLTDVGMAEWMLNKDFPSDTKRLLEAELKKGRLL